MSRQSQTNTFNDGLNKDLNPILTPNTVMTDCLNGTIITYNGNEFALQNDLGNYKFKHGSLGHGFVPVGIKEHANILYIISYNPITDEVEVGSFPSMKTISSSSIKTDKGHDSNIELKDKWNNYSSITTELTLLSELTDDFLLNPGDKYILSTNRGYTQEESNKISIFDKAWMNTSYYVFTENKKLYNIDDYIEANQSESDSYSSDDFKNVKWETPGWIAVKPSINVMDEFNCYIDDVKYTFNKDGKHNSTNVTIKIQSTWNSRKYGDIISDFPKSDNDDCHLSISDNLGYLVYSYDDHNEINWIDIIGFNDDNTSPTWYYRENKVVQYNGVHHVIYSTIDIKDCKNEYLAIVPVLRVNSNGVNDLSNVINGPDEDDKYIIYDQFTTILKLSKSIFDPSSVKIGDGLFKYYVGDNSLTINMNVNSNSNCRLFYKILTWDNKGNIQECFNWEELTEFDYNGQNIFSIDYDEIGFDTGYHFEKEDFYIIQFYVTADDNIDINNIEFNTNNPCCKEFAIYCSEYVNMYYRIYDHYYSNEFTLNEESFTAAIENGLKIDNPIKDGSYNKIVSNGVDEAIYSEDPSNILSIGYDQDINGIDPNFESEMLEYKVVDELDRHLLNRNIIYRYGSKYVWNFENKVNFKIPNGKGRLWNNISIDDNNLKFIAYDNNYDSINLIKSNEDGKVLYSLPVASESKLYIDPYIEIKEGATKDKERTFGSFGSNPPVTLLDNGRWRLNYVAFVWKDDHNAAGTHKREVSSGTVKPTRDIQFEVIDNSNIRVYVDDIPCDLIKKDQWEWSQSYGLRFWEYFSNTESKSVFDIKSFNWSNNEEYSNTTISRNLFCPVIMLWWNDSNDIGGPYYKISWDCYFDGFEHFSTSTPTNLLSSTELLTHQGILTNTGKRQFANICMPTSVVDVDSCFTVLSNSKCSYWDDQSNVEPYLNELFAMYFLMVDRIRYCTEVSAITKYISQYKTNHNIKNKIYIKSIEYKLSNVEWDWNNYLDILSNNSISINIESIKNHIRNLVFYDEISIDKIYQNNYGDISTAIDKFADSLNDKISTSQEVSEVKNRDEIWENGFYLKSDVKEYHLSELVRDWFKYENGKIIYKSPNIWPHNFWVKRKSGDGKDDFLKIASVNEFYLK